jgi:antitoxin CcdA
MRTNPPMSASSAPARQPRIKGQPKRAVNLSLSADLLDAARDLGINLSQACDGFLREHVRREQARRWQLEHADFIAAYNATLEAEGLPLDSWRTF